jgi:magnesium-transporting ATPase (P-type)
LDNNIGEVDTGADSAPAVSFDLRTPSWKNLARIAVLCNSAEFVADPEAKKSKVKKGALSREVSGSPVDGALLRIVEALEGNSAAFRNMHPKVCEIPFSPIIKFHLVKTRTTFYLSL